MRSCSSWLCLEDAIDAAGDVAPGRREALAHCGAVGPLLDWPWVRRGSGRLAAKGDDAVHSCEIRVRCCDRYAVSDVDALFGQAAHDVRWNGRIGLEPGGRGAQRQAALGPGAVQVFG